MTVTGRRLVLRLTLALALLALLVPLGFYGYWRGVGRYRGEAFYKGLPTAYWSGALKRYRANSELQYEAEEKSTLLGRVLDAVGFAEAPDIFLRDTAALPVLVELLGDPDRDVRLSACHALGQFYEPVALAALSRAVEDEDVDVRYWAIFGAGKQLSPEVTALLLRALGDKSPRVRELAVSNLWTLALAGERPKEIEDALARALNDEDPRVRAEAQEKLTSLRRRAVGRGEGDPR